MSKLPFRDMMRVRVCDVDGRLIRVLDLKVAHDVVLQGSTWRPGVVLGDEGDLEAMEICGAINELGFERDADGVPVEWTEPNVCSVFTLRNRSIAPLAVETVGASSPPYCCGRRP